MAKVLTLLALAIPIFWDDVRALLGDLMYGNEVYGALVLMGTLAVYLVLNRHKISSVLDFEEKDAKTGAVIFVLSMLMFVYGSYQQTLSPSIFHIIALALFLWSYFLLRMNDLLARIFAPLLAAFIVLMLLGNSDLTSSLVPAISASMVSSISLTFFDLDFPIRIMVATLNVYLYCLMQVALNAIVPSQSLLVLVLLSFIEAVAILGVVEVYPDKSHTSGDGARSTSCRMCASAGSQRTLGSFCPLCGRSLITRMSPSRLEIIGLGLGLIFLLSVALVSIPTLTFGERGLEIIYLRPQGPILEDLASAPPHWMLYEDNRMRDMEELYREDLVLRRIFVPEQFPEKRNYTAVIELTPTNPRVMNSWRFSPWKVRIAQEVLLGESISATYYEIYSFDTLLKVVTWQERVVLFSYWHPLVRTLAFSFFSNGTLDYRGNTEDITQFLSDVEAISGDWSRRIQVSNSWDSILISLITFFDLTKDFAVIALVAAAIIWLASYALPGGEIAEPYTIDFLSAEEISVLLTVYRLESSKSPVTGDRILEGTWEELGTGDLDDLGLLQRLARLERVKLLKRTIRLRENMPILEWSLAF